MKSLGPCLVAIAAWPAFAAVDTEHAPAPAPAPAQRTFYASSSLATIKRLTPEQRDEWRFLKEASASSRFESEAARLALSRSSDARVRSFATGLLQHHELAQPAINHMLHVRSITPPLLSAGQRKVLNHLGKLHGSRFDREFVEQVGLRSQTDGVSSFERASASVSDPVMKGWVDQTLPGLQQRLADAEEIAAGTPRVVRTRAGQVSASSSR